MARNNVPQDGGSNAVGRPGIDGPLRTGLAGILSEKECALVDEATLCGIAEAIDKAGRDGGKGGKAEYDVGK